MQGGFENCCNVSLGVMPKKSRSKAYCSALNCGNAKFRKPEISYFRFPRDPKRCRLWVNNCGLKSILDDVPVQTLYRTRLLCSEHFASSQYMNPEMRNKLIWNAIPTIFNHNMPVKQELDRITRKPVVILPNTLCLPNSWTSAAFGLNHYVLGHTNLNPVPGVNNGMNHIQIINTTNPVHFVNNNMTSVQVTRTIASPIQITNPGSDLTRVVSDPVQPLEMSSTRVRTVSSPLFTLDLTCENISDNPSEDSRLEAARAGQTMYVCCEKCKGLWREESFPSDHLLRCCGTVDASSADLFAIEKELLLVLRTHTGCLQNKTDNNLLDYSGDVEEMCEESGSCRAEYCSDAKVSFLASTNICSRESSERHHKSSSEDHSGNEGLVSIKTPQLPSAPPLARDVNMEEIVSVSTPRFTDSDLKGDLKKDTVSIETANAAEIASAVLSKHMGNKLSVSENKSLPVSDAENPTNSHILDISATGIPNAALEKTDSVEGIRTVSGVREERQMKYSSFLVDTCHKGKQEKRYQCSSCPFSTRMVGFFDRHMRSCHDGHMTCDVCSLSFESRSRFRKHMNMHIRPFMCEFCSQCFAEKREMEKHAWIHKEFLPFQCSECEYRCRYKRLLQEHSRKHTGDVLECQEPACGFTTCYRWALENHRTAKHSSCKSFTCDSCEYRTNCRGSLKKHRKLHQGRGDYVCSLCPFQAVVRHDLVRHLRKHTSEKIFFCSICSYSTAYSSSLHVHLMHHLQLKPWKCGNCDYNAVTKQKVSRHMQNIHPSSNFTPVNTGLKFSCNVKAFRRRGSGTTCLEEDCLTRDKSFAHLPIK